MLREKWFHPLPLHTQIQTYVSVIRPFQRSPDVEQNSGGVSKNTAESIPTSLEIFKIKATPKQNMIIHQLYILSPVSTYSVVVVVTISWGDLLGWMLDRPVPESSRLGYAQDIVEAARSDPSLADEIYLQAKDEISFLRNSKNKFLIK